MCQSTLFIFFFFNDTATTEIYTLSLHDALPILRGSTSIGCGRRHQKLVISCKGICRPSFLSIKRSFAPFPNRPVNRSEEHTSELQSQSNLVCRLLLEKKKIQTRILSFRCSIYTS